MPETAVEVLLERMARAQALNMAATHLQVLGKPFNLENLYGYADDLMEYIMGDDAFPIPRPDQTKPGRLPKA